MTFLNPLFLFGLVAAAIPVILHLLNLRKLRTIEFSTLTFLKELQQTKIRRLKLRQLLLLIIRTLLIILIVFAFARPALQGTMLGSIGTHAHSSVVFIIDDSFSMMANDEHGELFKQAKEVTTRLTGLLKDGDEVFLVKLSDIPQATINPATHDFSALSTVVNEMQTSSVRRTMEDAVKLAASLLQQSKNANKEIYIVSDMQGTLFTHQAGSGWNVPLKIDEQVKVFTVDIGAKQSSNAAIDSVEVKSKIVEKDKPVTVYTSVRNFSSVPLHDVVVSTFLDGVRAAQSNVSLNAWGSASVDMNVIPKRTGFISGYVELENDALEQDNRRYFTLYIPERISVAMIANSTEDVQFLKLALEAGGSENTHSLLEIQQTTTQKFPLLDLKKIDVLVLSTITTFTGNDIDRIATFVKHGGGVVLFPSPTMQNENSSLLSALNIPPSEGIVTSTAQSSFSFRKIDLDHPIFETIFENDRLNHRVLNIESPTIVRTLRRQAGKQAHTIISMSDGSVVLSGHTLGEGKILFYSIAPVLSWSDFPLKGIFAPLMYRSVVYVSGRGETLPSFIAGEEPTISVRRALQISVGSQYSLISPDGTDELIRPSEQTATSVTSSRLPFTLRRCTVPGTYTIASSKNPLSVFAVNIDPLESDIRTATSSDLESFWKRLSVSQSSIHSIGANEQLQTAILQLRFGVELWKYCIALALLLALLEMAIARDGRKALQHATGT
jgi:hypothetical protein